jgi:hypothetical protein
LRAEAGEEGGAGGGEDNTAAMAALQTQIDALKAEGAAKETTFAAQLAEKDEAARYWHEQAKHSGKEKKADTPIETPEIEEDPIEVMSKKGGKGLTELVAKSGFVTKAELASAIETRARQLTDEAALTKEYPDLLDPKSELFKQTATHYRLLIDAGTPHIIATRQAANNAYLDGVKAGKIVTKAQQDDIDAHAAAAGGDTGRKGGKAAAAKDDNELDAFQKNLCEQMGVSEEAYKARAQKGVVYTGSQV